MNCFSIPRSACILMLTGVSVLTACSDSGSVTTLDAQPEVLIGLPDVLLNEPTINNDNLRPTISLSNGANVSLQRGVGDMWSGTVNVPTGQSYTAQVVWVENINGQDLPLAQLEQIVDVSADGSVIRDDARGYDVNIDSDDDGVSNLQERQQGTDPFSAAPASAPSNEPDPNTGNAEEQDALPEPATNPATDPTTDLETDPATDPTINPATDPTINPATDPTTDPATDPTTDPATDPTPANVSVDVIVPRIAQASAPQIDGQDVTLNAQGDFSGEWAAAVQSDNSGAPLLIDNLMIDIDSEAPDGTPYRRWAAMHDGIYLYVVALVEDEGDRVRDSGTNLPQDDSLELFIDGDNSKSTDYDTNDFHRIFPVQLAGADKQSATLGDIAGPYSSAAALTLDFATGPGIGPDGIRQARFEQDVYELRIELSSAGIDPDTAFGFELQVNDDDNGGLRDSKWGWKHPSRIDSDVDGTFTNPSLMGTLKLE